jgi:hypothetical protein
MHGYGRMAADMWTSTPDLPNVQPPDVGQSRHSQPLPYLPGRRRTSAKIPPAPITSSGTPSAKR